MNTQVLMLCSSHVKHPSDGTPTGGWLEMIAQPYFEFTHSGLDVVIASVRFSSRAATHGQAETSTTLGITHVELQLELQLQGCS